MPGIYAVLLSPLAAPRPQFQSPGKGPRAQGAVAELGSSAAGLDVFILLGGAKAVFHLHKVQRLERQAPSWSPAPVFPSTKWHSHMYTLAPAISLGNQVPVSAWCAANCSLQSRLRLSIAPAHTGPRQQGKALPKKSCSCKHTDICTHMLSTLTHHDGLAHTDTRSHQRRASPSPYSCIQYMFAWLGVGRRMAERLVLEPEKKVGFRFLLCHFPAVWAWANYLTSRSLIFLFCKIGKVSKRGLRWGRLESLGWPGFGSPHC